MTTRLASDFRRWFWARPRAHGEVIEGRRVSPIELLYDLVYVAVIAQATHALGSNLTLGGLLDFVVIFSLVWIGWINGTLYMELHGREDGRTRSYVFLQMAILCLLAVFTGNAAGTSGPQFALTYVVFLLVVGRLYFTVSRVDQGDQARVTKTYALGLFASAALIAVSAFLPADLRLAVWAVFDILWVLAMLAGAAMVGLVEHAAAAVTPQETAWLLAGAVAVVLLFEILIALSFIATDQTRWIYRPLLVTMGIGAAVAVAIGFLPLPPWALAVALNALLRTPAPDR